MSELKNKNGFDIQEFINTLQTLDPQNSGSWPLAVKLLTYVFVFILVLFLGWVATLSGLRETLSVGEKNQEALLGEFEQKVFKAQNLEVYKRQLKDMEDSFGALLRQLPQETEVPGLLEDISHIGLGSGVDFDSIDLGAETTKDFYAEQPINIKAHGNYHAFGAFVSGIAALPRIVTLHDFKILPLDAKRGDDNGAPVLSFVVQAKTYRYGDVKEGAKK